MQTEPMISRAPRSTPASALPRERVQARVAEQFPRARERLTAQAAARAESAAGARAPEAGARARPDLRDRAAQQTGAQSPGARRAGAGVAGRAPTRHAARTLAPATPE
jgi:hypothetical protein